MSTIAYFHLPGLFESYDFYKVFLPFYFEHRSYFYDWCRIESIYGSKENCIWNGGRISHSDVNEKDVLALYEKYNISSRLTFSNALLKEEHISDKQSNALCKEFSRYKNNGIIITSDLLYSYLSKNYENFYYVSSTTKVLLKKEELLKEINDPRFHYVVPDFRWNRNLTFFNSLSIEQKNKIELLCNECCPIQCKDRKECYLAVSKRNLDREVSFSCTASNLKHGYQFSLAMENPSFISKEDIYTMYLPMGICNFKIEGRSLGSALLLEFLLYYLAKPEYHLKIREAIYLDNTLDLF